MIKGLTKKKITPNLEIKLLFLFFFLSFTLTTYKIVFCLNFYILPIMFFLIGLISYFLDRKKAILLFLFLLPIINSTPDIFFNGYPYNYMAVCLFYLSGIVFAAFLRKDNLTFDFKFTKYYLFFISVVYISAFFVFLRWSNITLSKFAFIKDTLVEPYGSRVSFASIFPIITLFLYSVSPFIFVLIKRLNFRDIKIFKYLGFGYCVSFCIAIIQRFVDHGFLAQEWWLEKAGQLNGGFSDFNSFGLFSGILFLYFTLKILDKFDFFKLIFVIITFGGVILSGSRTAFIFFVIAGVIFFFSKRIRFRTKIAIIVLFTFILMIGGGILKKRIYKSFKNLRFAIYAKDKANVLDEFSNWRITMIKNSFKILKKYPVSGIGAGNFLFYLKYTTKSESFVEDLPLNQYLLIIDETGLVGLLFFMLFLFTVYKYGRGKKHKHFTILFFSFLLALILGNYLWLPECFLAFWLILSLGEEKQSIKVLKNKKYSFLIYGVIVIAFIISNIYHFNDLHPKTWAKNTGTDYDYGFWYKEKNKQGEDFKWTKDCAGQYIYLDKNGESRDIKLLCEAPLHNIKGKQQSVEIYWKRRLYKKIVFRENREVKFKIKDNSFEEGFLEIRVYPCFNLKRMNLSEESRDLGVQFFTLRDKN